MTSFDPSHNKLVTEAGDTVTYDWLVIATGLQLRYISECKPYLRGYFRYDKIKGLPEAFDTPGVGSNYSSKYVEKTKMANEAQ